MQLPVRIPKADSTIYVELDQISDEDYRKLMILGLTTALNRGMYKLGPTSNLSGSKLKQAQAKALAIAEANLIELYSHNLPPNEIPKLFACQTGKNVV